VTNPSTGRNATDAGSGEHSSGMTLVLVFALFFFVGRGAGGCIIMPLMALSVTKKSAFVVSTGCLVGRARWRWCIRTRWKMGRRIPLCAPSCLLYVVPSLAVLIPLLDPAWWHWGWCTHWRGRAYRRWSLTIGMLLLLLLRISLALGLILLVLGRVALTLRRVLLLLRSLTTRDALGRVFRGVLLLVYHDLSIQMVSAERGNYPRASSRACHHRATPSSSS
jgi:hypothetical protein